MSAYGKNTAAVFICICFIVFLGLSACAKTNAQGSPEGAGAPASGNAKDSGMQDGQTLDSRMADGSTQNEENPDEENTDEIKEDGISAPSVCGRLSVKDTQLVDERGNPVRLRGISTHGIAWFPQYVNEQLFKELRREWKANVLRLAMYTAAPGGYCTDGDKESLKRLVKSGVEYAAAQDLYVIVDWHILSDGNPNQYKDEALEFFEEISKEFAEYDNVLYEICNEPNSGVSWKEIKDYAEEVIPVIRRNAPQAVILVGTPNWSQQVDKAAADPIAGYENLMYTMHFYAASHTGSVRDTMAAAVDAGLPVFVSEFGICDASGNGGIDKVEAKAWMQLLDQYQISFVAWNLSNKDETSAVILNTVDKASGFSEEDLSDSGKWLYRILAGDEKKPKAGGSGSDTTAENSVPPGGFRVSQRTGGLEVTATLSGSWETQGEVFCQYTLFIKNESNRNFQNWEVDVEFGGRIALSEAWNGNYSVKGDTLHISSAEYNGALAAGGSTNDAGFIVSGEGAAKIQDIY